jgi:hypothetical protein
MQSIQHLVEILIDIAAKALKITQRTEKLRGNNQYMFRLRDGHINFSPENTTNKTSGSGHTTSMFDQPERSQVSDFSKAFQTLAVVFMAGAPSISAPLKLQNLHPSNS